MSQKFLVLMSLVALCGAVVVEYRVKSDHENPKLFNLVQHTNYPHFKTYQWHKYTDNVHPKYEFEYAVSDPRTGDHKSHRESRDGDRVRGEYSLAEPGGLLRRVQYSADDSTGFNAIVSKSLQKHEGNAFSFIGHARHFSPSGHGYNTNEIARESFSKANKAPNSLLTLKPVASKQPNKIQMVNIEQMTPLPIVVVDKKNSMDAAVSNKNSEMKNVENKLLGDVTKSSVIPVKLELPVPAPTVPIPDNSNTLVSMTMKDLMALIMGTQNDGKMIEVNNVLDKINLQSMSSLKNVVGKDMQVMDVAPVTMQGEKEEKPKVSSDSTVSLSRYTPYYYYK